MLGYFYKLLEAHGCCDPRNNRELLGREIDTTIMCDSQSAIHLSKNQAYHEHTKHINVRHHFIREVLDRKELKLIKVAGEDNVADIFTKAIPAAKLKHYLKLL